MDGAGGPVPRPHPGICFDLSSDDPKTRVQAYLDSYKPAQDDLPEVGAALVSRCSFDVTSTTVERDLTAKTKSVDVARQY